jgi:hypothetical protein
VFNSLTGDVSLTSARIPSFPGFSLTAPYRSLRFVCRCRLLIEIPVHAIAKGNGFFATRDSDVSLEAKKLIELLAN